MWSKNKKPMDREERAHVDQIKAMNCVVCNAEGPSEAHEIEQGEWFLSLPLCADCHRGSNNGLHGRKAMWKVMHLNEMTALNIVIRRIITGARL